MSSSCRLWSLSVRIISVDCKNTRQAVVIVVKLSKEISQTTFKYMKWKMKSLMGKVHADLLVMVITSIDFYIFVVYELESLLLLNMNTICIM